MENQIINFLDQIADDIGCLLLVEYLVDTTFPGQPKAIIINFENQVFTVKAVPDDDSIEVVSGRISCDSSENFISVSDKLPWSIAIGKYPRWIWALINQQGYSDAVQFEFAKNISDEAVIIQLVTVASSIRIYKLNEISSES